MKTLPKRSCAGSGVIRLVATSVRYKTRGFVIVRPVVAFIWRICPSLQVSSSSAKRTILKFMLMLKLEMVDVTDPKVHIRVGPRSPDGADLPQASGFNAEIVNYHTRLAWALVFECSIPLSTFCVPGRSLVTVLSFSLWRWSRHDSNSADSHAPCFAYSLNLINKSSTRDFLRVSRAECA